MDAKIKTFINGLNENLKGISGVMNEQLKKLESNMSPEELKKYHESKQHLILNKAVEKANKEITDLGKSLDLNF